MCGRFSLFDIFSLIQHFNLVLPGWVKPRYNIAPSQDILAIVNNDGCRAVPFRWGLIPFWFKEIVPGMINARAETVDLKPAFKQSLKRRRCLIPADGFYEWKREGNKKRPYRIIPKDGDVFVFAGLWDTWTSPKGETMNSCAIITTAANSLMKPIHNRMPVILSKGAEEVWTNKDVDISILKEVLLNTYPAELMESYEVSTMVNNYRNDNPEVLKPL